MPAKGTVKAVPFFLAGSGDVLQTTKYPVINKQQQYFLYIYGLKRSQNGKEK